ncbi:type II secretion system protein GspE [Candidatus Dojkabacteria bacterium]|nr:type II secretion system protein GspE [Candidatus Dojkabacteria bacterium]
MSTGNTSNKALKSVRGIKNLVDALAMKGLIDSSVAKQLKLEMATKNVDPEDVLLSRNILTETELAETKAEMYGIDFVPVASEKIDQNVLELIPANEATKNKAVAFGMTKDGRVKLAMTEPLDIQKVKYLETLMGKGAKPYFSTSQEIEQVINSRYGAQITSEVTEALEDVGEDVVELSSSVSKVEDLSMDMSSAPVSKIVNMILEYAVKYKASDVHIEPRENNVVVRFRIYGVLSEKLTIPKKLKNAIVARVKILSNLKIDEKRIPQDGRFQIKAGNLLYDMRVSVMPSVYGEKVVMRLLEKGGGTMDLADTGLRGSAYKNYLENLTKTQGIILVTGPTGSGKTQTLASSLKIINKPEVNIMTIEDPVEIRINGVTQVQVNKDVGLDFATALRSFLRQDPDVIMVGEIRDGETANLAIQAALTGHLVLATLHTNSAAGALPRLLDMGIEPFLISSTVNVVVAQRLVRRICRHCVEGYRAPVEMVKRIHQVLDGLKGFDMFTYPNNSANEPNTLEDDEVILYRGKGCPKCNNTGFSGRAGIFECMPMSNTLAKLVMEERPALEIDKKAVEEGMITMMQDGFMKALEGITTIEEVLRVVK